MTGLRRNPRYDDLEQMERLATAERSSHLRLWRGVSHSQPYARWLTVDRLSATKFKYIEVAGERKKQINRAQAKRLVDKEWGRHPTPKEE